MHVQPHYPLQELLAQLLSGIETVTPEEQKKMVSHTCHEAALWHDKRIKEAIALTRSFPKTP